MNNLSYVIITPARNERQYISKTIESVITQIIPPQKWMIVSDGSTDGTDEIVQDYIKDHSWIELIKMPKHRDRTFAAKVNCFNAGYKRIKNLKFDIIGNLDADISFESNYFSFLLSQFSKHPELGVAGTPFLENNFQYDYRFTNIEHVSGACQLFRRKCYEDIGGYIPLKSGGIDWVAVTTARMKGWKTRTFTEKTCIHHRSIGTGNSNKFLSLLKYGQKDYYLGWHPLWELCRSAYQMKNKPYIINGLMLFLGYMWAGFKRIERPVPDELIRFNRKEQMDRLKKLFRKNN